LKAQDNYDNMARELGYRFRLIEAGMPKILKPGGIFEMTMDMANDGWARIINPRKVEFILRSISDTGTMYILDFDGDNKGNRLWLPGPAETKTLSVVAGIPSTIPDGKYDVVLNLPDPYPSIHDRPEYSIRLANKGVWEAATGFNLMKDTLQISSSADGAAYGGALWFARKGGELTPALSRMHLTPRKPVMSGSFLINGRSVRLVSGSRALTSSCIVFQKNTNGVIVPRHYMK
jgi:hypothetical protein